MSTCILERKKIIFIELRRIQDYIDSSGIFENSIYQIDDSFFGKFTNFYKKSPTHETIKFKSKIDEINFNFIYHYIGFLGEIFNGCSGYKKSLSQIYTKYCDSMKRENLINFEIHESIEKIIDINHLDTRYSYNLDHITSPEHKSLLIMCGKQIGAISKPLHINFNMYNIKYSLDSLNLLIEESEKLADFLLLQPYDTILNDYIKFYNSELSYIKNISKRKRLPPLESSLHKFNEIKNRVDFNLKNR